MSAGAGTKAYQEALKLERRLAASFGPDFREKVLVLPLGVWRLRDAFEECGLPDPRAPASPSSGVYGLAQFMPARSTPPVSPAEQLAAMGRYVAECFPSWTADYKERLADYSRWASGSPSAVADRMGIEAEARRIRRKYTRWPVSPAPRSPHGDPLR